MNTKRIFKAIHLLIIIAFAASLMLPGCKPGPAPTVSPSLLPRLLPPTLPPPPTDTPTPIPLPDVPIYKNTFEGSVDLAVEGSIPPGNTVTDQYPECGLPERSAVLEARGDPGGGRLFFADHPILHGIN